MDKENTIIRRLYLNKWVRIPVKIIISMAISKIVFDFSEHVTKFRRRNPNPRFVSILSISVVMIFNLQQHHTYLDPTFGMIPTINIPYNNTNKGY